MILYHITKRKHLASIFTSGLIPAKRKGMRVMGDKCTQVFLTNDIQYIIDAQCGKKWIKQHDCVVLHIDTKGMKVQPLKIDGGATYTLSNVEFVTDSIPRERIVKIEEITEPKRELLNKKVQITTGGNMDGSWNVHIKGIHDADLYDVEVAVLKIFDKKKKKPVG